MSWTDCVEISFSFFFSEAKSFFSFFAFFHLLCIVIMLNAWKLYIVKSQAIIYYSQEYDSIINIVISCVNCEHSVAATNTTHNHEYIQPVNKNDLLFLYYHCLQLYTVKRVNFKWYHWHAHKTNPKKNLKRIERKIFNSGCLCTAWLINNA